jgi:hypothetical protein
VGQLLSKEADKRGVEPVYVLSEKTDPNPTVKAPHCICHYPISFYPAALEAVRARYGDRARQLGLFV